MDIAEVRFVWSSVLVVGETDTLVSMPASHCYRASQRTRLHSQIKFSGNAEK
jgi:hypothetical protein